MGPDDGFQHRDGPFLRGQGLVEALGIAVDVPEEH
jgi:hypothetical protein